MTVFMTKKGKSYAINRINTTTSTVSSLYLSRRMVSYDNWRINSRRGSYDNWRINSRKVSSQSTNVNWKNMSRGSEGNLRCTRSYSVNSNNNSYSYTSGHWKRLMDSITNVFWKQRYPGSIYASSEFSYPYPRTIDWNIISLALFMLIEKYAYKIESEYVKLTIGYKMNTPSSYEMSFTLGNAIPLYEPKGYIRCNSKNVYDRIEQLVIINSEKYHDCDVKSVFINIYYEISDKPLDFYNINFDILRDKIFSVVKNSEMVNGDPPAVKSLLYKKSRTKPYISPLKGTNKKCRSFIVADLETVLEKDVHIPYAAGYLVVNPGDDLTNLPTSAIKTFFSESHITFYHTFQERSYKMLFEFFYHMENSVNKKDRLRTIYLHNLGRFDGIFIMKYFVDRGKQYNIKPLMRNHRIYELKVYRSDRLLFRFRDSLVLLPSPLSLLGKTLCPELGSKGSIPHDLLSSSNLQDYSNHIIEYLRQDILILGGVMLKAQKMNFEKYSIDIEDVMTVSALSLKIFRNSYFDDTTFHISIPTKNQDTFIRRGYYGGHVDVYKPHGENLYYYDVNSLYPFIMKTYSMPCGTPVWNNNLEKVELDSLYGFIEAYVVCPTDIERPFLPYKDKAGTLLFPTGKFIGVFYSEELKFARNLGYHVIPLRGYLYEKLSSPFEGFISSLYESRLEAKKAGDEAMSFIYKILMNSLYGRFGMNPESIVTEVCSQKKYEEFLKKENFQSADKLTDDYYIVHYISNQSFSNDDEWKPPKMSAVQLSAAITACARIHMYPYISRSDCYYTDTDSIVLGNPLPEEDISSIELGKFKLENKVKSGIFLAPKSYMLDTEDDRQLIKHKGPAKDLVTSQWFKEILANQSLSQDIQTTANFRIDWKKLQIGRKNILLKIGLPQSTKRDLIYDYQNVWIGTKPIYIIDLGNQDATTIFKYELEMQNIENVSQSGQNTTPLYTPSDEGTSQDNEK